MTTLKTILVARDFSPCSEQAVAAAVLLAARTGAELHVLFAEVLHGDPFNPAEQPAGMVDVLQARLKERLEALPRESFDPGSLRVRHHVARGVAPAPAILDYARDYDVDLIVMGTHGRRGVRHLLLGSVAEEVVRLARCPVFTIRASEDAPVRFERILAPVDFSAFSSVAVAYAKALAALYGARLDLLHVVEEVTLPGPYGIEPMPTVTSGVADRAQEALLQMAAALPGEVPVEAHVLVGHAARDVLDFAAIRHTDLVVIATHGRTGIARLLLGSVAEKVVRMAPCPVFTIKSFGKRLMPELPLEAAEAPPRPKPGGLLPRAAAVL